MLVAGLTLSLLAALGLAAASEPPPPQSVPEGGISSKLQPFVDQRLIAGAVVLVATKDRVLACEAVGYRDLSAKKVMTTDCLFEIASMSKPIAATAVMMLVDAGKISVDDPVEKYLPEFRNQMVTAEKDAKHILLKKPKQRLLIRHLLTHTGGLLYSGPLEKPTLDALPLRTVVAQHAMLPLQFEPGSKYFYANGGIGTLARIVEVISGMPYDEFLDNNLFKPLGMKDTTFWPDDAQLARLAKCYKAGRDQTALQETPLDARFSFPLNDKVHRYAMPGIGLFSTAADVLKFCQMFLNGGIYQGKRYLSAACIAQMTSKQTQENVKEEYGFGWAVDGRGGFSHGGSFNTCMSVNPELDLITIYLSQYTGPMRKGGEGIQTIFEQAATGLSRAAP